MSLTQASGDLLKILFRVTTGQWVPDSNLSGTPGGSQIQLRGGDNLAGQLTIFGKGGKTRVVLLSPDTWGELTTLRGQAGPDQPVFVSRKGGATCTLPRHGALSKPPPPVPGCRARFPHIGFAIATLPMPLTEAPRFTWCRPPWAMRPSPPRAVISTPALGTAAPVTWGCRGSKQGGGKANPATWDSAPPLSF